MVQLATQLALFLENKPGTLARLCDALNKAGVNIHALTTSDTVDHCVVRLIVSDTRRALKLVEEHGCVVVETEVLLVEALNKPGALAAIAHKLTRAGINIDYTYFTTAPSAKQGLLILRVNNSKKAMKVLNC